MTGVELVPELVDFARERLAAMEAQRRELDEAIADLRLRLAEGERILAGDSGLAAE